MRSILIVWMAVLAVPAFAQDMPPCPEDEAARIVEGEAAFARYCRACHTTDHVLAWMAEQPTGEAKEALAGFLGRHGPCPARVDEVIADYFSTLSR